MFVADAPSPPPSTESDGELAELPLEAIEREIESLAAHINAGKARWLRLIAEFDRRGGWGDHGCRSCSEWVAWRCALEPRSAREHVRVARALCELPLISDAFSRGALSFSKVRALTRIATPESEEDLLYLARHATAAQLERIVRAARRVSAAEADEDQRESFVRYGWDEHGCLCVNARLPAEEGALFLRALEASRDALYEKAREDREQARNDDDGSAEPPDDAVPSTAGGSAEPPPTHGHGDDVRPAPPARVPSNAESLAAMAETALARPPNGGGGGRHQVFIHVDADSLAADVVTDPDGECAIADGPGLAPETVRRLLCDGSYVAMCERDGEPLSVGRATRTVPAAMRRALVARDGHCQYPGCERWRFVDAHHIHHWAHGGETSLENLVLLCRHHHRLVHEGGVRVERASPGPARRRRGVGRHAAGLEVRFCDRHGTLIVAPSLPPSDRRGLPEANRRHGVNPLAGTVLTGSGEHMDLGLAVDAALIAGRGTFTLDGRRRDV